MICILQGGGDGVDKNDKGLCRCGVVDTAARQRRARRVGMMKAREWATGPPTKESLHFCCYGSRAGMLHSESRRT
jgi:hypothetical protein